MKIAFIGGGSLRVLPIVRSLLKRGGILQDGAVSLIDLDTKRSEAVARMIRKCPEFMGSGCDVRSFTSLEEGLTGVDSLYVTMAVLRQPSYTLAARLAAEHGIWHSDMLSPEGAFLAARSGGAMLHFAQVMERVAAPGATMLIFANPVPVFSAIVNSRTRIRAFGICQGFGNHRWDIARICGINDYVPEIHVVSCGVNHFSMILRGEWNGRDIFKVIDEAKEKLGENYREKLQEMYPGILGLALGIMMRAYEQNGQMLFSSEADGLVNQDYHAIQSYLAADLSKPVNPAMEKESLEHITSRYNHFYSLINDNSPELWDGREPLCGFDDHDLSNEIYSAMASGNPFRIAASAINNGAVKGMPDNFVLEYTMDIKGKSITPVPNQYVPSPYFGLISQYAEHQTLLAEAVAEKSPRLFAQALDCFPATWNSTSKREFYTGMVELHPDLPDYIRQVPDFL